MTRTFILIFLLFLLFSVYAIRKDSEYYTEHSGENIQRIEVIEGVKSPHYIEWISDNTILIVKNQNILKYDIHTKSFEKLGEREEDIFVGLDADGDVILCEAKHFLILSPDDFSTILTLRDINGNFIKELKIFDTVRPISASGGDIITANFMPFQEEEYFKINIETGEKTKIEKPIDEFPTHLPEDIEMKRVFKRNENLYLIENTDGDLILYNTFINTNTTIPISTAIFNAVPIRNPISDANPNFILSLKSFLAKIYSEIVAPKNAPMNTP